MWLWMMGFSLHGSTATGAAGPDGCGHMHIGHPFLPLLKLAAFITHGHLGHLALAHLLLYPQPPLVPCKSVMPSLQLSTTKAQLAEKTSALEAANKELASTKQQLDKAQAKVSPLTVAMC